MLSRSGAPFWPDCQVKSGMGKDERRNKLETFFSPAPLCPLFGARGKHAVAEAACLYRHYFFCGAAIETPPTPSTCEYNTAGATRGPQHHLNGITYAISEGRRRRRGAGASETGGVVGQAGRYANSSRTTFCCSRCRSRTPGCCVMKEGQGRDSVRTRWCVCVCDGQSGSWRMAQGSRSRERHGGPERRSMSEATATHAVKHLELQVLRVRASWWQAWRLLGRQLRLMVGGCRRGGSKEGDTVSADQASASLLPPRLVNTKRAPRTILATDIGQMRTHTTTYTQHAHTRTRERARMACVVAWWQTQLGEHS